MMMRRTLMGIAGAALAVGMSATGALAQEVTLRMHQFLPPQANVPKLILDVWADKVEAASDDKIKIERYPSMQLGGKPPELMDQAIDGVADIVWTVVGYTPGRYPTTEVFELPFMVTDARAASSAYWQMFEKHMKDTEFKDVHILGTWVHGPGLLHTNAEVRSPDDMQGLKIRGGSRLVNQLLLSKGVIDGTTIPWEVTPSLKVPELVKNHTEFDGAALYTLTFVLAMNKDRYDGLSDELKKVLDDNSGLEFSVFAGGTQADADGPARQVAVDLGNNVIELNEEETRVWRDASQPIYDSWIADMDSKGIDGQALIDEARELMDAYGK